MILVMFIYVCLRMCVYAWVDLTNVMRHSTMCVTSRIDICHVTHAYVCHDSRICVP